MSVTAERLAYRLSGRAAIPVLFIVPLLLLTLAPRVAASPSLTSSFWAAGGALALWYVLLLVRAAVRGEELTFDVQVVRTHYVQALVQGSVYVYWAQYWPFIEGQVALIFGQFLFAYAFSVLLSWSRGERWRFGFGPLPIILSTNFFMCFKDNWFYVQFGMIALGMLGKELIRWRREGRLTHIFNPSALSLFLVSVVLIATGTTELTWAEPIAIKLGLPDHIYLWIFLVGLVVQGLFRVTLVTLASAAALYILNVLYFRITGIYWFMDAGIPIAVFLGLHLLVTDPATSPRTSFGRFIFGALYGLGVFVAYGLLEWAGAPRFYDKLLCVPLLNLMVPLIERLARDSRLVGLPPFAQIGRLNANAQNLLFMGIWALLFAWMSATDFIGKDHVGLRLSTWEDACAKGLRNGCRNLLSIYRDDCAAGNAGACLQYADLAVRHGETARDPQLQVRAYARACDLTEVRGCLALQQTLKSDDVKGLDAACTAGDGSACYILGTVSIMGFGGKSDAPAASRYFQRSCERGVATGCSVAGDTYRFGVGTKKDLTQAARSYERACDRSFLPACLTLSQMLNQGEGVARDRRRARGLIEESCVLGLGPACEVEAAGVAVAVH